MSHDKKSSPRLRALESMGRVMRRRAGIDLEKELDSKAGGQTSLADESFTKNRPHEAVTEKAGELGVGKAQEVMEPHHQNKVEETAQAGTVIKRPAGFSREISPEADNPTKRDPGDELAVAGTTRTTPAGMSDNSAHPEPSLNHDDREIERGVAGTVKKKLSGLHPRAEHVVDQVLSEKLPRTGRFRTTRVR